MTLREFFIVLACGVALGLWLAMIVHNTTTKAYH
jgi:hypothetical protein